MNNQDKTTNWSYEKEIVFEGGAAISISIGYSNMKPGDVINVISGLGILAEQVTKKVILLKEVSE
ncbi:hypothetical protein [Paenibacillus sp. JJ1722]|uniref:hypothetical protein n=1 Tax=Paenibacillus sp. JJ1722 TaxID=3398770 RepID=UPI003AAA7D9B